MKYIINTLIILFSVFSLPLIFFYGELHDILWLRVASAVLLIPYMMWWGFYGYNLFFGKKKEKKEQDTEDPELKGDNDYEEEN
jgi:hypothetical protein